MSSISSCCPSPKNGQKNKAYFQNLNFHDLICFIQPQWNKYNMGRGADQMTEKEMEELKDALEVYKEKGGDMAYFTSGAGAPGNCVVC